MNQPKLTFRQRMYYILHLPTSFLGRFVNGLIALLIILSIAVIPFHFIDALEWTHPYLFAFETAVTIIFTVEYILRIWSAGKPLRYVFSWFGLIDLAAILPFYLELANVIEGAHIFLLLRILRLLKLGKIFTAERFSLSYIAKKEHGKFRTLENEHIERVFHKHPVIFLLSLIPPLIFVSLGLLLMLMYSEYSLAIGTSVLFFAFSLLFFIKAWLDFHYDVIYVTNHRIILQNRQLFGSQLNDIVYEAITNIKPDNTGLWHFLLGFGNIHIETASTGNRIFEDISDPHKAVEHISANRQKILEKKNRIPFGVTIASNGDSQSYPPS